MRGHSRPVELQPLSPVESKLQRFLGVFTRWVPPVTVLRLTYREELFSYFLLELCSFPVLAWEIRSEHDPQGSENQLQV